MQLIKLVSVFILLLSNIMFSQTIFKDTVFIEFDSKNDKYSIRTFEKDSIYFYDWENHTYKKEIETKYKKLDTIYFFNFKNLNYKDEIETYNCIIDSVNKKYKNDTFLIPDDAIPLRPKKNIQLMGSKENNLTISDTQGKFFVDKRKLKFTGGGVVYVVLRKENKIIRVTHLIII